jgi:2,5-diketo-D-gluconate reductase B
MAPDPAAAVSGGQPIPRLGLGTFGRTGEDGQRAIETGLELGYRHLDTAQTYDTEENVGRAVAASRLPRAELFVATKIADFNLARDRFLPSLRESLDRLALDQVDLTLIHWPSHRDAVPFGAYMEELARARELGLTRLIGVSNFTISLIDKAVALLGPGAIATNQVELHPYLQNRKLRARCQASGIAVTAYMPLAKGRVTHEPAIRAIAAHHDTSAAAVTLAWLLHQGIIVIPASGRREHMEANLDALSLALSVEEAAAITALDRGDRMINPAKSPDWD